MSKLLNLYGIISGFRNKSMICIHNDNGSEIRIFAIGEDGNNLGLFYLGEVINSDWEDIELGLDTSDELSHLYLDDIGDNKAKYEIKYIYRIAEPLISSDQFNIVDTLKEVKKISFSYTDGQIDLESLMVDLVTGADILLD